MRGELGYEKFGTDMYKVWKRTSPQTPNTYYLVGFVRKVSSHMLGIHWEAWNMRNKCIFRAFSMKSAAKELTKGITQ